MIVNRKKLTIRCNIHIQKRVRVEIMADLNNDTYQRHEVHRYIIYKLWCDIINLNNFLWRGLKY